MKFEPDKECEWARELIDAFLDDELSGKDKARLENHVAACFSCKEELALARKVKRELRALPQKECPERVVAAILEKIPAESPEVPEEKPGIRAIPWFKWGFRLAFAAALIAVIWLATPQKPSAPPEQISPAELAAAERQFQITLAYVGYMSTRSTEMVRDEVVESKIAPAVQDVFEKVLESQTGPFKFLKPGNS